jgi:hypothetical protein
MRLTWSRYRFDWGDYGSKLKVDGVEVATVQPLRGAGKCFWYARHDRLGIPQRNTADNGVDLDTAKAQCETYVRKCLEKNK